ncbi:hypothetical protein [Xanthomonas sacchari]|uniref:hypothetical protein n=1 Tax=Xanthomonas sacchari TaxID=56458 RepID=UPI0020C51349|nr:hypothetical protein [Xanthomonas sacchari]
MKLHQILIVVIFMIALTSSIYFGFFFPAQRGGVMENWVHNVRLCSAAIALLTGFPSWRWLAKAFFKERNHSTPN